MLNLNDDVILEALKTAYKKGYEVPIEEKEFIVNSILDAILKTDNTINQEMKPHKLKKAVQQ